MCGITGWVAPAGAPIDERSLAAMTRALAHRGPDGEGLHLEPGCGLGHRRLSLLDRPGGAQPMAAAEGDLRLVANNEIYNYLELRQSLAARGHRFTTSGDTEVLLHLYEDLGEACVEPLVGMFAFALWDRRRRTLLLARDRFGVKPLYYHVAADGSLRFASELRALLAAPGVPRDLDWHSMHAYLRDLSVPEPRTILRDVHKLPAAHVLVWHEGSVRLRRYWNLPPPRGSAASPEALEELEAELLESTALSLRSDEPVGLFLSGGLDSSLLAWSMRTSGARPLRTFSVSFAEPQVDESRFSRAVAAAFDCEHREIRVTKDEATEAALRLVGWLDEPFADSSALPTLILSREARKSVKAVLSGEGADELFAGSPWHLDAAASDATVADQLAPQRKVVFPPSMLDDILAADLRARLGKADAGDSLADMPAGLDRLHRQLWADIATYLPADLLTKIDRMTMLESLEARVPYLNHPLAERIWSLPAELKLDRGVRKVLLRSLGERLLPAEISARPKQGFAVPMDIWLWEPGRFRDAVYDTLRDPRCRTRGWFDPVRVDSLLDEHDRLRGLHGHRLWTLFVLEHWLRRWYDGIPKETP